MRKFIRWAVTGAFVLLAIFVGTLFRQNIEVWATKKGYDSFLAKGLGAVAELGYETWVLFAFFFLAGATTFLWVDHWYRGHAAKSQAKNVRASIAIELPELWHEKAKRVVPNENVEAWNLYSRAELSITLFFKRPVKDAIIEVAASKRGLKWAEVLLFDRGATIEISGEYTGQKIYCNIYPSEDWPGQRRQAVGVEYDTLLIEDEGEWRRYLDPAQPI